ncbi:MAG: hypothetical protein U0Z53_26995 [Blastocatellia bacterium]
MKDISQWHQPNITVKLHVFSSLDKRSGKAEDSEKGQGRKNVYVAAPNTLSPDLSAGERAGLRKIRTGSDLFPACWSG